MGADRVVAAGRRRVAVADQVGRDHGVALGEPQGDLAPVPRGVDHPVDEHDRRAAAGRAVDHPVAVEVDLPGLEVACRAAAPWRGTVAAPRAPDGRSGIVELEWQRSSSRGSVKTFGPIRAVDGLDLDVAGGHLPRPARPQRSGQVDDDAAADGPGDRRRGRAPRARLRAPRGGEGGARGDGRRPPARQPRHRRHRRGQPARSSPASIASPTWARPSSGRSPSPGSRPPPRRRRRALRRHAPAPAARARPRPRARSWSCSTSRRSGLDPQIRTAGLGPGRGPARARARRS